MRVILLLPIKVEEGDAMRNDDRRFMLWAGAALVLVVSALLLLLRVLGLLGGSNEKTIAAALTFLGVVITACSLISWARRQASIRASPGPSRRSDET